MAERKGDTSPVRRLSFAVSLCATLAAGCSKPSTGAPQPKRSASAEAPAQPPAGSSSATAKVAEAQPASIRPIATPRIAGADPCRVGPSARLHSVDKSAHSGVPTIEIAYGASGGMAAWQAAPGKLYTQRLDLAGNPSGSPAVFSAPREVYIRRVLPLSSGFVIMAEDYSDNPPREFVWITDAAGRIVDEENLDLGPHFVDALSEVVADRMLFFLSNRNSTNQDTSRVLLLTMSGGRAHQQSFDFPVAVTTPMHHRARVELALGARDWSVWRKEADQPALLLSPRGVRAVPPLRLATALSSRHDRFNLRYLGDTLQAITAVEEGGERNPTTLLRIDTLDPDGTVQPGKPFTFVSTGELPAPFVNELSLSYDSDSKTAKRETFVGPHAVGAPISLRRVRPPLTEPLGHMSVAWSSKQWVIAYYSATPDGGSMNVLGIRCGP